MVRRWVFVGEGVTPSQVPERSSWGISHCFDLEQMGLVDHLRCRKTLGWRELELLYDVMDQVASVGRGGGRAFVCCRDGAASMAVAVGAILMRGGTLKEVFHGTEIKLPPHLVDTLDMLDMMLNDRRDFEGGAKKKLQRLLTEVPKIVVWEWRSEKNVTLLAPPTLSDLMVRLSCGALWDTKLGRYLDGVTYRWRRYCRGAEFLSIPTKGKQNGTRD